MAKEIRIPLITIVNILICFLILSCKPDLGRISQHLIFDLAKGMDNEQSFKLSDFVESIIYIPLETSAESIIDEIRVIVQSGDKYIIGTQKWRLKVFDSEGNYLNDIGRIGQGPGEFLSFSTVFWNEKNQEVIVPDSFKARLNFYKINGEFLREEPIPYRIQQLFRMNDGTFLGVSAIEIKMDSVYGKYFLFNSDGMVKPVLSVQKNYPIQRSQIQMSPFHCQLNGNDLFITPRTDTIYIYQDNDLLPFASLNLSHLMLPDEIYFDMHRFATESQKYIKFIEIAPAGTNQFFAQFGYNKKGYIALCTINNGKFTMIKQIEELMFYIPNDLDGGFPFYLTSQISQNVLYLNFSPSFITQMREKHLFEEANPEIEKLINSVSYDDNPIIMKLQMKR